MFAALGLGRSRAAFGPPDQPAVAAAHEVPMAIEAFTLRMLCQAKRDGAEFGHTLTLGRQRMSLLPRELDEARAVLGRSSVGRRGTVPPFAEDLLPGLLGIDRLSSMDCSAYEGASVIHDLNFAVPQSHWDSYDAVIDGGTLEHVFNVPVAMASCMRMLRTGGRFFSLTPANNHFGHGFYQFSPELFFRVFDAASGFQLEHVLAIEHPFPGIELSARRRVYAASDPAAVGERVGLVNHRPVYLFVQAVKLRQVEPFTSYPQQSDYATAWEGAARDGGRTPRKTLGARILQAIPYTLRRPLSGYLQRRRDTFRNRRNFHRWDPPGPAEA